MLTQSREPATPEARFSHRLARGLRRNLFQRFADQETQAQQAWSAMRTAAMPFRSRRDEQGAARLASARMAASLRGFRKAGTPSCPTYSGFEFSRFDLTLDDELFENQIGVTHLTFTRHPNGAKAAGSVIGGFGAHAIERLFQRRATTNLDVADDEICSALPWMHALSVAAKNLGPGRSVCQLPIPTRHGAFLARWLADSSFVWVRTWVCAGTSPRIDNTVAALRAWHITPCCDPMDGFRMLLAMPANRWLSSPYEMH